MWQPARQFESAWIFDKRIVSQALHMDSITTSLELQQEANALLPAIGNTIRT
jgi:hypothetical protein